MKISIKKLKIFKESNNRFSLLTSLKQTFLFLLPVFMIGAFSLSIESFPIKAVREFIASALNGKIKEILDLLYNATYGFAAVYLVMVLSVYESQRLSDDPDMRIYSAISSAACYFGFMGIEVFTGKADILNYTKIANIFPAMIIALGSTHGFFVFYKLFYHTHREERLTAFERGIHAILPFVLCLLFSVVLAVLIGLIPGINNFNDLIVHIFNKLFSWIAPGFFGGFIVMFAVSVLWIFGIHGGNVFDELLTNPAGPFSQGAGHIVTKSFLDTYVLMGGCGTSVCLLIALLLFGKSRKNKRLAKMSCVSVIFNINEPIIFGLPIVLNVAYAIPFIVTPLVAYTIAYLATIWGIVPAMVNADVQWTTPVLISGYQATGSVAGSILQLVILAIGVAIYSPFVKFEDKLEQAGIQKNIDRLTLICKEWEKQRDSYKLVSSNPELHALEDDIAAKVDSDIRNGKIRLYYQPQVKDGRVISAEALLRFGYGKNANDKFIYPPLVVGIATSYGLFDPLSRAVVERALEDLTRIQKDYDKNFRIAVNVSLDLIMEESFRKWMIEKVNEAKPSPHTFGIEITEDANLSDDDSCAVAFDEIKNAGIEVQMDDFSMGHTSITILQKNYFDYIKIDGNLIKRLENERSRSIVSSIVDLGKRLNFTVIAEYVETTRQRDLLLEMGCEVFQGYLYYKAMPADELTKVIESQTKNC